MKRSKEETILINIIKNILQETAVECSTAVSCDYGRLFLIAKRNSVANTVADLLCKWEDVPKDISNAFLYIPLMKSTLHGV